MLPRVADKDPWSQFNDFRSSPGLIPQRSDGLCRVSQGFPPSAAIVGRAHLWQYPAMDQNEKGRPFRRSGAARASGEGDPRVFPSAALGNCLWFYSLKSKIFEMRMKRPDHVLGGGSSRDSADGDAKRAEPLRRKEMNRKLIKWAAACVLSVGSAASALAASVTSPGQTIGSAAGGPAPPRVHFLPTP